MVDAAARLLGLSGRLRSRLLRAGAVVGASALLAFIVLPGSPAVAEDETHSFFSTSDTPETANWPEPGSLELGVKFTSDVDGTVTTLRFYKGNQNTGTHTGSLWTADGSLLGTATFSDETESGWQSVDFDTPVQISAGTTYVASYHTSVGFYSVNLHAFATSGVDSGPLHIPAGGSAFRSGAGFPDQPADHNYWIDVVFHPKKPPSPSPSPTVTESPEPSATATATASASVSATAPPGDGGDSLPVTGSNAAVVAGMGLLLAGLGAVLVVVHRRRRARFIA
jgi:LPXTG-motif cell wall-anchored protein